MTIEKETREGPTRIRMPEERRSWMMLPGADGDLLQSATTTPADVLVQEMEDLVPEARRPEARALCPSVLGAWRAAGKVAAARLNPLEVCGLLDLEAVMPGRPNVVMLAMAGNAAQIISLDDAIGRHEVALGIEPGSTEIVPCIETAAALVALGSIAAASVRVTGLLLASEDMTADLRAIRTPECTELAYVRSRFLVECRAAGKVAIDYPYTHRSLEGAERDIAAGRALGFQAKCVVNVDQVPLINRLLSPSPSELELAERIVAAFEAARSTGQDRVDVDGLMVEVPTYRQAQRVLARADR